MQFTESARNWVLRAPEVVDFLLALRSRKLSTEAQTRIERAMIARAATSHGLSVPKGTEWADLEKFLVANIAEIDALHLVCREKTIERLAEMGEAALLKRPELLAELDRVCSGS